MLTHAPVLLRQVEMVVESLDRKHCLVDATLGLGGHFQMLLSHLDAGGIAIGIDRDQDNLDIARKNLSASSDRLELHHSSFSQLSSILGERKIDAILYDLGVSSAHYDDAIRGFSIREDGPLDMRFDRSQGKTAQDLIYTLTEKELAQIMFQYADEKKANFIARAIVERREHETIDTTLHLREIIRASSYDPKSPMRVFQALRIAVNDEFAHIEDSLRQAVDHLAPGGRILVITFHSIEDRLVKNFFAPYLLATIDDITGQTLIPAILRKAIKKPIIPTEEEMQQNPRSRSAKLRIYEKN